MRVCKLIKKSAYAALALVAMAAFAGCKGRTLDNVEPTGETVEVNLDTADADSAR